MADTKTSEAESNEELLVQIREDFRYCKEYWRENHDESAKDVDFVATIPPADFAADREGRPCIWPDEISQYVKQANNNLRQTKRSIKISPRSEDAKDVDAEHRQAYIRGIEYASKAQSVYTTASEDCIESAFGYWRLVTKITGANGEQEPRLLRIPNQFSVYPDPDAEESDFSDSNIYFVMCPPMRQKAFARKFPGATKKSFSREDMETAGEWFHEANIVPAEYWRREEIELEDGEKGHKVTQYITNGLEILEKHDWLGSWIPIIGVFGEELYVRRSGQVKRLFLSLVRRARPAQQMLAYIASQEAEEFGMAPRAPMMVVEGSVDPDQWKFAHKVPTAYLEYKIPVDWNAQTMGPFPAPMRQPFSPNVQAYEVAYERWRRSVQSAMGISPLPTSAQRQNEKSGVALEKIQNQEAIGSYHFTDDFIRALDNTGRQINELITKLAQSDSLPKQVLGKDQKDEDLILRVAPSNHPGLDPASEHLPEADLFFAHRGQFEITVSDGPSYQSQREESAEFADNILQTIEKVASILPPGTAPKFLALAIKLKNIGAIGDEMVDLLTPEDQSGEQLQQAQQQLAQAQQAAQEMQAELQKLQLEKAGKVIENEGKMRIEEMRLTVQQHIEQLNADLKAYIANVQTKAQSLSEREKLFQETQTENHHAAHDIALQKDQQQHEKEMAASAAANQQASQAADQQHQQAMAEQAPEPEAAGE